MVRNQAELLQEGIFFLLQLFARGVLAMKKLEIEKIKPTFIISTFKTDIIKVGLVFSISNFFDAKTSLANNWRSFSSSYLALCDVFSFVFWENPRPEKNVSRFSDLYFKVKTKESLSSCIKKIDSFLY